MNEKPFIKKKSSEKLEKMDFLCNGFLGTLDDVMIEACTVRCELRSSCNPLFKEFEIIVQAQNQNQDIAHTFSCLVYFIKGSTKLNVFGGNKVPFDQKVNKNSENIKRNTVI